MLVFSTILLLKEQNFRKKNSIVPCEITDNEKDLNYPDD